jgi:glycosyltransferase involved in cell wall biosynthesis
MKPYENVKNPAVSVIMPAYNCEKYIEDAIRSVMAQTFTDWELIVINDCSKDNTLQICRENEIPVLDLPINLGIGGAVQTGYLYALKNHYDVAVQMDGDGQHDALYLKDMEETLVRDNADMVIGSRFIEKKGFQSSGVRRVGIGIFKFLTGALFGKAITDATSGMRMSNRRTIELFVKDYPRDYPEPETVCRLLRKHYKVVEVPVVMKERETGTSSTCNRVTTKDSTK